MLSSFRQSALCLLLFVGFLLNTVFADEAHVRAHKNYTETRKRCERETCRGEDLNGLNGLNCVFKCISYPCWLEVEESMILENGDTSFRKVRRNKIFANCARRLKREADRISRETKSKTDLYAQVLVATEMFTVNRCSFPCAEYSHLNAPIYPSIYLLTRPCTTSLLSYNPRPHRSMRRFSKQIKYLCAPI
jgi:hypothetical protein